MAHSQIHQISNSSHKEELGKSTWAYGKGVKSSLLPFPLNPLGFAASPVVNKGSVHPFRSGDNSISQCLASTSMMLLSYELPLLYLTRIMSMDSLPAFSSFKVTARLCPKVLGNSNSMLKYTLKRNVYACSPKIMH